MAPGQPLALSRHVLLLLLFGVFGAASFIWDLEQIMNPERIRHLLERSGPLAPVVFVALMSVAVVLSPIPSLPLDVAAGAFFGPVLGTVYSLLGGTLGALAAFSIARALGRQAVEKIVRGHINFCQTCSDKLLTRVVFVSRLLPFVSFDFVSYGAGLTAMSPVRFGMATFFGMIPLTVLYNTVGGALSINTPMSVLLGVLVIVLFFALPRWIEDHNLFGMGQLFRHTTGNRPEKED